MKVILWMLFLSGIALALWANAGDAMVLATVANTQSILEGHALHDDALRDQLTAAILMNKYGWTPVMVGGLFVSLLAAAGLVKSAKK